MGNQSGNTPTGPPNKRKRLNDGSASQPQSGTTASSQPGGNASSQQPGAATQSQNPGAYSQQSLFASDPSLQSRYAGLAGSGFRATPGVSSSSLAPTLGDAIPQPVGAPSNGHPDSSSYQPGSSSAHDTPSRPPVGSEEWHKQRRDNHKEVERRRRETINDGISELAKIVPNCEKNKGSILARAVQYILQLKENESHNIEKWTLDKLLTDQAMAELQATNEKLKVELERAWREAEAWKKTAGGGDSSKRN